MKRLALATAVVAAMMTVGCNQEKAAEPAKPEAAEQAAPAAEAVTFADDRQKQSYALGAMFGQQAQGALSSLKELGIELDAEQIQKGMLDSLKEASALEPAELQATLQTLQQEHQKLAQEAQAKAAEEQAAKAEETKAAGAAYLAENAKKEGVKVTESGLQYEVLTAGEGESPKAEDVVEVHYKGTLLDGTQFDSSYDRGQPTSFPLNQVIPGWTEGVQLMKPGAKYRFVIPSDLAYGERGAGASIPAHSTLIFEVELLAVNPKAEEVEKEVVTQ